MAEKIKLIWDFRGFDAEGTARHHAVHLNEFVRKEGIENHGYGVESITEVHHIAFLVVTRDIMPMVRDALLPHRGELA